MFAAAAVAAAAALTAISTSTAVGINSNTLSSPNNNHNQSIQRQQSHHISWHQYAMQRRNSLQRRKFEIDKRIKQASAANNKNKTHSNEIKQFQQQQQSASSKANTASKTVNLTQSLDTGQRPVLTYQYAVDHGTLDEQQIEFIKNLKINNQLDADKEAWIRGLSSEVFNEFIKLYNEHKAESDSENFEEISNALLEYLQISNNLNDKSEIFNDLAAAQNSTNSNQLDYKKAAILAATVSHKKSNRRSKQKYDSLRYKWNPKWLRLLRKTTCLPVAIITLLLLIFTNLSSNWIYIEENQRAGLWTVCKSKIVLNEQNILKHIASNEIDTNSLVRRTKRTKQLFEKPKQLEECHAKFLLKDDTHLVVLALVIVGFFFHLIGLVFIIVGLFFTTSNKLLYYYHSAGECLLSSALILAVDLLIFASLVSSQINQPYKFGYCFYSNLVVSLVTFFYSLIFYLDDFFNEYHNWRKKIAEEGQKI